MIFLNICWWPRAYSNLFENKETTLNNALDEDLS